MWNISKLHVIYQRIAVHIRDIPDFRIGVHLALSWALASTARII